MTIAAATELVLIRHAPARDGGRLCGRTDVDADLGDAARLAAIAQAAGRPDRLLSSPARRCRQTAAALWPEIAAAQTEPDLWEQDFGAWEGRPLADLPDLGPLDAAALARHRPPGGESFADLCERAGAALERHATGGRIAVIAHAGTVRAALALALGSVPAALAFEIAPASLTRLARLGAGPWSVRQVNWLPA